MTDIYTPMFREIFTQLSGDRSIALPYRNFAVADAKRLLATIHEGQRMSNRKPEFDVTHEHSSTTTDEICTCPEGGRRADCPWHGNDK